MLFKGISCVYPSGKFYLLYSLYSFTTMPLVLLSPYNHLWCPRCTESWDTPQKHNRQTPGVECQSFPAPFLQHYGYCERVFWAGSLKSDWASEQSLMLKRLKWVKKIIELNFIFLLMSHAFHSFNFDLNIFLFETCPSFLSAKIFPKNQLVIVEFN